MKEAAFEKFLLAREITLLISPVLKYLATKWPSLESALRARSIDISTMPCILKKSAVLFPLKFGDISATALIKIDGNIIEWKYIDSTFEILIGNSLTFTLEEKEDKTRDAGFWQ